MGFHNPTSLDNGLSFDVNGFIHTGKVIVNYNPGEDLFQVKTINPDGSVKEEKQGVYLDGLVDTIDRMVEHCPNYAQKVRQTYGL